MAFPKPKDRKPFKPREAVHFPEGPGGREVCNSNQAGRAEYKRRRELAWRLYGGKCGICGLPVTLKDVTVDHIKPRGMGGANRDDRIENLQPAHAHCNTEKGSKHE